MERFARGSTRCWLRRPSLYLAGFALYGYQTIVRQAFRRIRRRFPRLSDLPSFYCLSSFQPESENRLRFLAIFSIFKRNLHNCIFDLAKIVARLKRDTKYVIYFYDSKNIFFFSFLTGRRRILLEFPRISKRKIECVNIIFLSFIIIDFFFLLNREKEDIIGISSNFTA